MAKHSLHLATSERIDTLLNYASIVALILLAFSVSQYALSRFAPMRTQVQVPTVGARVPLDADWTKHSDTVIVAIQTDCAFCDASMPFYDTLVRHRPASSYGIIIVTPLPPQAGRALLAAHKIPVEDVDVRQAPLASLRVGSTPTLMLVGSDGRIKRAWVGQLPEYREREVLSLLGVSSLSSVTPDSTAFSIAKWPLSNQQPPAPIVTVIDTRSRKDYAAEHVQGSLNIPIDELSVRLPHELLSDAEAVVICAEQASCPVVVTTSVAESKCGALMTSLKELGFTRLTLFQGPLAVAAQAGLRLVREVS